MIGVDPRREEESRVDPPRADPRDAGLAQEGHIAPGPLDTSVPAELVEATVSRPSLDAEVRPGEGSNFMSLTESPPSPRRPRIAAGSHGDQPHQPNVRWRWQHILMRQLKARREYAGWLD